MSRNNSLSKKNFSDRKYPFCLYKKDFNDYLAYYTQTCEIEAQQHDTSATKYYFDYKKTAE